MERSLPLWGTACQDLKKVMIGDQQRYCWRCIPDPSLVISHPALRCRRTSSEERQRSRTAWRILLINSVRDSDVSYILPPTPAGESSLSKLDSILRCRPKRA